MTRDSGLVGKSNLQVQQADTVVLTNEPYIATYVNVNFT